MKDNRLLSIILPVFLILISITLLSVCGCNRGSSAMSGTGKIIDRNIDINGFTRIDIQGDFVVEVQQGEYFSIIISTDDNLISRILVSREDETLKMSIKAPANFFPTSLKTIITMPRIYGLHFSKGVEGSVAGFKSTYNCDLNLSEGSSLTGYFEAGIITVDVTEDSQLNLAGSALEMDLTASNLSILDLENFSVENAKVSLKENSKATVNVSGNLDIALNEASKIYYVGDPTLGDTSISSDSLIAQK